MIVYKGTDQNMCCKGKQYEIGKTEEEATADLCKSGLHACLAPIDVLKYYSPASSRYFKADADNVSDQREDDSKVVSKKLTLTAEIGIPGLVKAQIQYVKDHCTTEYTDQKLATAGYRGAATAGDCGAATAGYDGAATAGDGGTATAGYGGAATAGYGGAATAGYGGAATAGDGGAATAGDDGAATAGDCGAATAGDGGAATAGYRGAATAGDGGAATAGDGGAATAGYGGAATAGDGGAATSRGKSSTGQNGLSVARGNNIAVCGGIGALIEIAEEKEDSCEIDHYIVATVDGKTVKADTWYKLECGELKECEP